MKIALILLSLAMLAGTLLGLMRRGYPIRNGKFDRLFVVGGVASLLMAGSMDATYDVWWAVSAIACVFVIILEISNPND